MSNKYSRLKPVYKKAQNTLPYEIIYQISVMYIVDKMDVRLIAKNLRIKPKLVQSIVEAKSHQDYWIDCVAELARKGLLNG